MTCRVDMVRLLLALALAASWGCDAFQIGAGGGPCAAFGAAGMGAWGVTSASRSAAAFAGCPRLPFGVGRAAGRGPLGPTMQRLGSIDFFKVLGVGPNTPSAEVKKKYRKLAMENHPDTSEAADAKEQFQLINEAYKMISDPVLRRALSEGLARRGGGAAAGARSRTSDMAGKKRSAQYRRQRTYRVGDVVGHKTENWIGVILGMDTSCEACDEWIMENNIDLLRAGRNQRFFHVLPHLQEKEDGMMDAEMEAKAPAFFIALDEADEWPSLSTAYLAEDQMYHFRFNTPEAGMSREQAVMNELGEHDPNSPVKNALLGELFTVYARGRYAYDERLSEVTFTPVANSLWYEARYGEDSSSEDYADDDEEEEEQALLEQKKAAEAARSAGQPQQSSQGSTVQPPTNYAQPGVVPKAEAAQSAGQSPGWNVQPPSNYAQPGVEPNVVRKKPVVEGVPQEFYQPPGVESRPPTAFQPPADYGMGVDVEPFKPKNPSWAQDPNTGRGSSPGWTTKQRTWSSSPSPPTPQEDVMPPPDYGMGGGTSEASKNKEPRRPFWKSPKKEEKIPKKEEPPKKEAARQAAAPQGGTSAGDDFDPLNVFFPGANTEDDADNFSGSSPGGRGGPKKSWSGEPRGRSPGRPRGTKPLYRKPPQALKNKQEEESEQEQEDVRMGFRQSWREQGFRKTVKEMLYNRGERGKSPGGTEEPRRPTN